MPIEDEFNPAADNPFIGRQQTPPEVAAEPFAQEAALEQETSRKTLGDHWGNLSKSEKVKLVGVTTATASLAALAIIGGPELIDRANGPDFGTETTTITIEPGDTVYGIVESIPGHENASTDTVIAHLKADPANIDVFQSDILRPGTTISIPVVIGK